MVPSEIQSFPFPNNEASVMNPYVTHILSAVTHAECYAVLHTVLKTWDQSMVQLNMNRDDRIYSRKTYQLTCWKNLYFWKSGGGLLWKVTGNIALCFIALLMNLISAFTYV